MIVEAENALDDRMEKGYPSRAVADEFADRARKLHLQRLRALAAVRYISSPDKLTLQDLAMDPRFVDVRPTLLAKWAASDRWDEQREQFSQQWKYAARERLAHRFVRDHMEDLEKLARIKDEAIRRLEEETLKVGKYDTLLKGVLELMKMQSKLRDVIIDATLDTRQMPKFDEQGNLIAEPAQQQQGLQAGQDQLDEEERRLAAQAVLAYRAQKQNAAASEAAALSVPQPPPKHPLALKE